MKEKVIEHFYNNKKELFKRIKNIIDIKLKELENDNKFRSWFLFSFTPF